MEQSRNHPPPNSTVKCQLILGTIYSFSFEKTPPHKILEPMNSSPKTPPPKILESGYFFRWFRPGFVAVSLRFRWTNETSNETTAQRCIWERNRKIPVSRYKYYNPANRTVTVSLIICLHVVGFVRFRWSNVYGFVRIVAVSLVSFYFIFRKHCRKSEFDVDVLEAS